MVINLLVLINLQQFSNFFLVFIYYCKFVIIHVYTITITHYIIVLLFYKTDVTYVTDVTADITVLV